MLCAISGKRWLNTMLMTVGTLLVLALLVGCGSSDDKAASGPYADASAPDAADASIADASPADAVAPLDAAPPPPLPTCTCDVTALCDTGCSCDLACGQTVGPPPAGADATIFDRAEVALYYSGGGAGPLDTVTLFDDAFTGTGGVTKPYAQLLAPTTHVSITYPPVSLAADVDNDGRDDAVIVTPLRIYVESWTGSTMISRIVHTYASAPTSFDAAVGDLLNDGSRLLAVSRLDGTTLTVEIYGVPPTGDAALLTSTTLPNVRTHAITIGRDAGNQPNQLYVLTGATGGLGATSSKQTVQRYMLSAGHLVAGDATAMVNGCDINSTDPQTNGSAIAVGSLTAGAPSGIAVATYCDDGSLNLTTYDPAYTGSPDHIRSTHNGTPTLPTALQTTDFQTGRVVRPYLAIGSTALSGGKPAVLLGATSSSYQATIGAYAPGSATDIYADSKVTINVATGILTGMALRDSNRDGVPEVFASGLSTTAPLPINPPPAVNVNGYFVMKVDQTLDPTTLVTIASGAQSGQLTSSPGPAISVGDFDADSIRVRATGKTYAFLGFPFINAVIAAPPTWLGKDGVEQVQGFTTFGTSNSTGTSDSHTLNATVSVATSGGEDFGIVEFGYGFKTTVDYSSGTSTSTTTSYGTQTTVGPTDDVVLFRVVPYVAYEYVVLSHPNPTQIDTKIRIDVPSRLIETTASIDEFRKHYGSDADVYVPPGLLKHTVGDPTTYPGEGTCTIEVLTDSVGVSGATISDVYVTSPLSPGQSGSTVNAASVDVSTQTGTSTSVDLTFEANVEAEIADFKLDVSAGVGQGWTHETTVGKDVTYQGGAGDFISGYSQDTSYEWSLCVFNFTNPTYGAYPVISYTVRH